MRHWYFESYKVLVSKVLKDSNNKENSWRTGRHIVEISSFKWFHKIIEVEIWNKYIEKLLELIYL